MAERDCTTLRAECKPTLVGQWREMALGEVIELKRGYDLPKRKRAPGSVPLVSSSGISDYHTEARVQGPGVVTGRYGTLGEVYFVPGDFWPLNTTLYVRDFKGNTPRFIAYLLKTVDFSAYSDKAAVPGVNRNHLHQALVRVPALPDQCAIAHVLGTLDDKIELNRRMNQTLEEMARAIFKDWFIDFGPTLAKMECREPYLPAEVWGLFPDSLVDSELGPIPEGWEIRTLEELVQLNPVERMKRGTVAPYLNMAALPTSGPNPSEAIERAFTSGTRFRNGDTLLARITPCLENGKTAYIQSLPAETVGWGSTEFIVMRAIPPIPSEYTYLLARDPAFRAHAIQSMTGTSGRQRARTESLTLYPLPYPPLGIWLAFGLIIERLFDRVETNREQSNTLATLRDTLLPKLLSGEVELGDNAIYSGRRN